MILEQLRLELELHALKLQAPEVVVLLRPSAVTRHQLRRQTKLKVDYPP
jgi:hypothetical protein